MSFECLTLFATNFCLASYIPISWSQERRQRGDAGYPSPLAGPGGGAYPLHFFSWNTAIFPGNPQLSVFIKNIRDWDITEEKQRKTEEILPSGNGGFRDLTLAACCERLLPSANLCEFEL